MKNTKQKNTARSVRKAALKQTPSQTIGPYFAYCLTPEQYGYDLASVTHPQLADITAKGEQIIITGKVYDGEGNSCDDSMLEFWQCDSKGKYVATVEEAKKAGFRGYGRVGTGDNEEHIYKIRTIKPKGIKGQAPYINVIIFMRGMLNHQYTRIYFSDEKEANLKDHVLNLAPKTRRSTLIAKRKSAGGLTVYHFDIHMQGKKETIFFDV